MLKSAPVTDITRDLLGMTISRQEFMNNLSQIISRPGRERSLQDIDKDIETIWKELQELDKPRTIEETCEPERWVNILPKVHLQFT